MAFPFRPIVAGAAAAPHHPHCNPHYRGFSSCTAFTRDVVHKYFENHAQPVQIAFDLDCAGCCVAYLERERNYTVHVTVNAERAEFVAAGAALPANFTWVFVRDSHSNNATNAQLATYGDFNLGHPGPLVTQGGPGLSYRLYGGGGDGELAMGVPGQVCLERIVLNKVKVSRLGSVRVNLADAAVQELYRQKIGRGRSRDSLRGQVYVHNHQGESHGSQASKEQDADVNFLAEMIKKLDAQFDAANDDDDDEEEEESESDEEEEEESDSDEEESGEEEAQPTSKGKKERKK